MMKLVFTINLDQVIQHMCVDKPFLEEDVYEFTTHAPAIDIAKASSDMDRIKVVPNPYFAASAFEGQNTFNSGRGPREIQFRYLPSECTSVSIVSLVNW